MSAFENATGFADMLSIGNTVSGGYLAYSIIVTLFAVSFLGTLAFGRSRALQFASFMSSLGILVMGNMGLMEYWLEIPCLLIFAVSTFMLQQKKNEYGAG